MLLFISFIRDFIFLAVACYTLYFFYLKVITLTGKVVVRDALTRFKEVYSKEADWLPTSSYYVLLFSHLYEGLAESFDIATFKDPLSEADFPSILFIYYKGKLIDLDQKQVDLRLDRTLFLTPEEKRYYLKQIIQHA